MEICKLKGCNNPVPTPKIPSIHVPRDMHGYCSLLHQTIDEAQQDEQFRLGNQRRGLAFVQA